jgi:hypothetical protein
MSWHKSVAKAPVVAEAHQAACGGTFRDDDGTWRVCNLVERHAGKHKGPTVEEFEAANPPAQTEVRP